MTMAAVTFSYDMAQHLHTSGWALRPWAGRGGFCSAVIPAFVGRQFGQQGLNWNALPCVDGDWYRYEAGVKAFVWYRQISAQTDTIPMDLTAGNFVGFDVIAGSRCGVVVDYETSYPDPVYGDTFGMLAENLMLGKENDAAQFRLWELSAEGYTVRPPCWTTTQCYGDSNGDAVVTTADWPMFRDSFTSIYPQDDYNPCADYNRDGAIDTADWPAFRDYFGDGLVPADCPMDSVWPPIL